jgi:RecB family endonuclease NucS
MLSSYFLQIEGEILPLIIIALVIIIPTAVLLSRRKGKTTDDGSLQLMQQNTSQQIDSMRNVLQEQINAMRSDYGDRFQNIPSEDLVRELDGRVRTHTAWSIKEIDKGNRERIEKLTEITDELKGDARDEMAEYAKKLIAESSVSRQEFEDIERRLDRFAGDETKDEYLQFLSKLFDSRKQQTINWKCNLIKLLRSGIAPDIDQEKLLRESIPAGSTLTKFLKNLVQNKIVDKQNIDSFVISEDYHWMYSYIDKPQWLKDEFERRDLMANKEKDYQKWLNNNLHKVESGLLKEEREMSMETGTIDFFCRDVNGQPVGLELKYPKATKSDGKQIIAYAKEQRDLPGGENFRGIMVAPEIHDGLKKLLAEQRLEYKEIIWNDEENKNNPVSESLEDTLSNEFEAREESPKSSKGTLPKGF